MTGERRRLATDALDNPNDSTPSVDAATDTTAYIHLQAQGVRVRPLEIDWDAEIRHWLVVYSKATR